MRRLALSAPLALAIGAAALVAPTPAAAQPAAPSKVVLIINSAGTASTLAWNPVSGTLDSNAPYRLRWRTKTLLGQWNPNVDGQGLMGLPLAGNSCMDNNLEENCVAVSLGLFQETIYEFQVAATNASATGPWSTIIDGTIHGNKATAPAGAPTGLRATRGSDILALTWDALTPAIPATDVISYRVRWREADTTAWQGWISSGDAPVSIGDDASGNGVGVSGTSYTITGLDATKSYDIQVAGVNQASLGSFSTTLTASPDANAKPLKLDAPAFVLDQLLWNPSTETLATPPYRHRLRVKEPVTPWTLFFETGGPTSGASCTQHNFADPCLSVDTSGNLSSGIEYEIQIAAVNGNGRGPWSDIGGGTSVGTAETPLGAPSNPVATAGAGSLALTWGGLAFADSYRVRWRETDTDSATTGNQAGNWQGWVDTPTPNEDGIYTIGDNDNGVETNEEETTSTAYTITGLEGGISYDVAVAAVIKDVRGAWSAAKTATPLAPPPSAQAESTEPVLRAAGAAQLSAVLDVIGAQALDAQGGGSFFKLEPRRGGARGARQSFVPAARSAAALRANIERQVAARQVAAPLLLSEQPISRDADWRDLLGASSFRLNLTPAERWSNATKFLSGGTWSVWGAGDVRGFSGSDDVEGLTYAGYVGTDYKADSWLAGIAASYSATDAKVGDDKDEGDLWFAGAYPYARYTWEERVDVWLLAGAGYGALTLDKAETPLVQHLYAAGAKADIFRAGNLTLAAKTDGAAIFSLSIGEGEDIDVMQQRFRLAADVAYDYTVQDHTIRPHLEIGARIDFADDTTIPGAELAAGIQYNYTPLRLAINARGRALVYDTTGILREWGAGATIRMTPAANGTGISASLTPAWGTPQSRTDDMWQNQTPTLTTPQALNLRAELAYTINHKQAHITPLTQYSLNAQTQTFGLGTRFNLAPLSLEVLGEHITTQNDYRLRLTSSLRF